MNSRVLKLEKQQFSLMTLLTVIMLEGFVTISVEMLTIRQLIPVVGNSVVVTSLIIGVFLLFLAYGYRRGGNYSANYVKILQTNFTKAALWIGIGLSYLFINTFFKIFESNYFSHTFFVLFLYLLVVTAPLVYFLGQTVPITMSLFKQEQGMGVISGHVLHLSTLGSFLGSVLTTLVFMNYLGVAWTIVINFFAMAFLILLLVKDMKAELSHIVLLISLGIIVYTVNVAFEKKFFVATNDYADYRVLQDFTYSPGKTGKIFLINDSISSFLNNEAKGFEYTETIKKLLFDDLNFHNKDILVLGAGGFTLSAERTNENHFTYVDIDKDIRDVAARSFTNTINGKFIAEDARVYVQQVKSQYDVIVSDNFTNKIALPHHLLTREHFQNIHDALRENGIAIFNIIAKPMLDDAYSKHVDTTIRSVFTNCMALPERYSPTPTNILYVCKKSASEKDTIVYTDNRNSSTLDYFKW